jgi:thymidylate kinase
MIIALIGNDGSGKTTVAKELAGVFKDIGFDVVYKHEYDYAILKFLFRIGGKERIEKARQEMLVDRKKDWKFKIWPFLVWFDTFVQHVYYSLFKRNSMVILDRYPYDHYVSFGYLDALTTLSEWLYLHFPRPDLVIPLWVEPEIAFERKRVTHSYQLSFYETQTGKYLQLAEKLGIEAVNTNASLDTTIGKILDLTRGRGQMGVQIVRRAFQNKTYFETLAKSGSELASAAGRFEVRKQKFVQTIGTLKELFFDAGVSDFAIFKDYDDYRWIGNDVDVVIGKDDFERLLGWLGKAGDKWHGRGMEWKASKSHSKAVDIVFDGLLGLDVHAAIGWRGIDLMQFNEIERSRIAKVKFGIEYPAINPGLDALIYAFSHVFEKGFVTYLEFLIIKRHLKEFSQYSFSSNLEPYLDFIRKLEYGGFPIFIPQKIIYKSFARIMRQNGVLKTCSRCLKIIAIQLFWRSRYRTRRVLPFCVQDYENE